MKKREVDKKMKIFRKSVSRILSLLLVLSLMLAVCISSAVSAETNTEHETLVSQTVANEYDMYKDFNSKSENLLIKDGYTKNQITDLKSVDFKQELKKKVDRLAKLDDTQLVAKGYSVEQIKDIKNYTGSEEQVYALSATLTFTTIIVGTSKSSTYSQATFRTSFTWSSVPVWLETDIIAVPWSEGMYLDTGSFFTYGEYDYYDEYTDTYVSTSSTTVTPELNKGASIKIDMGDHNSDIGGVYAKKGVMGYRIFKEASVTAIAIQPTYGHTTLHIGSPSVSFPAGVSVSFSWGTDTERAEYKYVSL
jgi:hypothetical protein